MHSFKHFQFNLAFTSAYSLQVPIAPSLWGEGDLGLGQFSQRVLQLAQSAINFAYIWNVQIKSHYTILLMVCAPIRPLWQLLQRERLERLNKAVLVTGT